MISHANLPSVAHAKLPAAYSAAKTALATCGRIDECKDWADKAAAMASYARQAGDDTLRKQADRIQARAIRRCGELLKAIEPKPGARTDREPSTGDGTRSQAARDAGLSKRQQVTATRVANVPEFDFERDVESDEPPTVTARFRRATLACTARGWGGTMPSTPLGLTPPGLRVHTTGDAKEEPRRPSP